MIKSPDPFQLKRFVEAQEGVYETALAEIRAGEKRSHWMWFIFPQLAGLGRSPTAQFYGIGSISEARAYLDHPVLGRRYRQAVEALLPWAGRKDAISMLGSIDSMKLRSSLTLFEAASGEELFAEALTAFFGGPDISTLELLS